MTDTDFQEIYSHLLSDLGEDENILGCIRAGSRAKGLENSKSDLDVYIIFKDDVPEDTKNKYRKKWNKEFKALKIDLNNNALQTISEFSTYAKVGTEYEWDRYNLVHSKVDIYKTLEIKDIIEKINRLDSQEQEIILNRSLGDYITHVYRSLRSLESGDRDASLLDASESIKYLLVITFALHSRVRPFNKYLEWEIRNYPLEQLPWTGKEFMNMIFKIIKEGTPSTQQIMYKGIEKLARSKGFSEPYDSWGKKLNYVKTKKFSE